MNRQIRMAIMAAGVIGIANSAAAQIPATRPLTDTARQTSIAKPDTVVTPSAAVTPPAKFIRPQRPKPITKEFSGGVKLNTDGWGIFAERGKSVYEDSRNSEKFYNVRIFQVELSEHKHPKEKREPYTSASIRYQDKPKPYILGKINNFYSLKLGYGSRRMIAGKPEPGTISIHWVYAGGVAVGLLKPYYLDVYVPQDNPPNGTFIKKAIRYEDDPEYFLDRSQIVGSSGWAKGLDKIKVVPGIHAKTGLHFDFAASSRSIMALETGISAELYTQKIELMVRQKSFPYIVSGYISLQFGKRW